MRKEQGENQALRKFSIEEINLWLFHPSKTWEIRNEKFNYELDIECYNYLRQNGVTNTGFPNWSDFVKSDRLKSFLNQNRPETLFFDPAEVTTALNNESDIVSNYTKNRRYKQWDFLLNPQKFILEKWEQRKMVYTKPLKNHFLKGYFQIPHPEPYIVVQFPAKYDDEQIVFCPVVKMTYGCPWPMEDDELHKQMIRLLGVTERKVDQKLDFKLRKSQRNFPEGEISYEYIVTVDLQN